MRSALAGWAFFSFAECLLPPPMFSFFGKGLLFFLASGRGFGTGWWVLLAGICRGGPPWNLASIGTFASCDQDDAHATYELPLLGVGVSSETLIPQRVAGPRCGAGVPALRATTRRQKS